MLPQENLKRLNLSLPQVSTPGGSYQSVNVRGLIAYVAVQFPILDGKFLYQGKLGKEITTDEGIMAMRLCALNLLAQINAKVGFENIAGLNHLDANYVADGIWDDGPLLVDGASQLMIDVLEDRGLHSRSIYGVARLPRDFCVSLTASFTLRSTINDR